MFNCSWKKAISSSDVKKKTGIQVTEAAQRALTDEQLAVSVFQRALEITRLVHLIIKPGSP